MIEPSSIQEWAAYYKRQAAAETREITAERDQLRAQLETASSNARHYADRCVALEAEVERLRGELGKRDVALSATTAAVRDQLKERWKASVNAATARAKASEKDAAECRAEYRALFKRSGELSDRLIAAESSAAGLRRALEKWVDWLDKPDVKFREPIQATRAALAAGPDDHARRIKAEALREAADEVYNRLNAKGEHAGARRQGWEAGLVDFADHLNAEADRLEKGATNGQ